MENKRVHCNDFQIAVLFERAIHHTLTSTNQHISSRFALAVPLFSPPGRLLEVRTCGEVRGPGKVLCVIAVDIFIVSVK